MKCKQIFRAIRNLLAYTGRMNGISILAKIRYSCKVVLGECLRSRVIGIFGLRLVEISLTDRCNCRCEHCFAADQRELDELSCDEVKTLLDEVRALGVSEVCFSGGEPLLHPNITELVSYAAMRDLQTRLITNGILLDEKTVLSLKKAGLRWCSVSLDGPTADIHDAFRGYDGCYKKAIGGLAHLVRHGVPCSIITVARRELLHSGALAEVVKVGRQLNVNAVRINFPVPMGRYEMRTDRSLSLDEREEVRELLRYSIVTMESPSEGVSCTAAVTKVNVLPNGDVTPCVFVPLPYGNIRHQPFKEIWRAMGDYYRSHKIRGKCPLSDPTLRMKILREAERRKQLSASVGVR